MTEGVTYNYQPYPNRRKWKNHVRYILYRRGGLGRKLTRYKVTPERRGGSGVANGTIFYWGGGDIEHFCF
jgi:hypothetical protein